MIRAQSGVAGNRESHQRRHPAERAPPTASWRQKMCSGELAMMISGPWSWIDLRKCGIDFDLAPLPGVGGNPGRPFVGVLSALINRAKSQRRSRSAVPGEIRLHRRRPQDHRRGRRHRRSGAESSRRRNEREESLDQNNLPECAEWGGDAQHSPDGQVLGRLGAALQIATNGQATPQAALDEAQKLIEK